MDPLIARDLDDLRDFVELVAIAVVLGAIAGLVGELIIGRGKGQELGRFELPKRTARWLDFGSFASIPVGALAAVLTTLVALPTHEVVVNDVSTTDYDLVRVVILALAAGLSGGAVLAKFQEGLTAALTAERLKKALGLADVALETIQTQVATASTEDAAAPVISLATGIASATTTARNQIRQALREEE